MYDTHNVSIYSIVCNIYIYNYTSIYIIIVLMKKTNRTRVSKLSCVDYLANISEQ